MFLRVLAAMAALLTLTVQAQDAGTVPTAPAGDAARCDDIVGRVSKFYSDSFDLLVQRQVSDTAFAGAMSREMRRHFENSGMSEYGRIWDAHFSAVGDQLAPELIEGYLHYQCLSDTLATPIASVSDTIDAACWDAANDGKMEILDARVNREETADLKRISRSKILDCITDSLAAQDDP